MTKGAKQMAKMLDRPSQRQIAKRLGVAVSYVSLLKTGKRIPSMTVAAKIQKELGIPVDAWTA